MSRKFRLFVRGHGSGAEQDVSSNEDSDVVGLETVNVIERIVTATLRLTFGIYLAVAIVTAVLAGRVNWTGCEASTPIVGTNAVIGAFWPWTLADVFHRIRHPEGDV